MSSTAHPSNMLSFSAFQLTDKTFKHLHHNNQSWTEHVSINFHYYFTSGHGVELYVNFCRFMAYFIVHVFQDHYAFEENLFSSMYFETA